MADEAPLAAATPTAPVPAATPAAADPASPAASSPAAGSPAAAAGAAAATGAPGLSAAAVADPAAAAKPVYTPPADWRGSITDTEPDAKEFVARLTSPADAVKIAMDLRKANSMMVRVPGKDGVFGKDVTPEEKAKFNKAIGVPDTVEGYTFELGREATEADKAIQGNLAKIAFDNGIPAVAMSALSKAVTELATTAKAEENRVAVEARAANEAALRKEWGADYEANKTLASRAVQAFGEIKSHPEVIEFFDKTLVNGQKLGDHPVMVRMLGNVGRRMGEGEFIGAVGADQRASLQSELSGIMSATPPGSDGYRKADVQKRVMEINEALHGTESIVGTAGRTA